MLALTGCDDGLPDVTQLSQIAPEGAAPGTCWDRIISPAVIETRSRQVVLTPAVLDPDGAVISPAIYRTDSRQEIVEPRQERWFETPCAAQLTPELISSLQRALTARDIYAGPINGALDGPTQDALRRYQRGNGLDSPRLSLETARAFGLISVASADQG
ncbi:MAG: peptidoglycan-binding domain-containing protein [Sedimentitalea sp.]